MREGEWEQAKETGDDNRRKRRRRWKRIGRKRGKGRSE